MAALDLVSLIEGAWFGRLALQEPEDEPSLPRPPARHGSSGSLSDAALSEQEGSGGQQQRRTRSQTGRRPAPQPAQGHAASRYSRGRPPEEDDGVLGTWAGRQRVFSDHLREQEQQQDGPVVLRPPPQNGKPPRARQNGASPPAPVPGKAVQQQMEPVDASLDQEMNAAWRWRFARKWQAEQMKQFEGQPATRGAGEEEEEEWQEAMRLMDAVDAGLNMQIGRTLSLQNSSGVGDSSSIGQSLTLLSPGLGQVLLEGSIKESPLREESADATSQIVSMARKAQLLRRQQQEIERQVNERWEAASGGPHWVAQHLPAVQIDSWSSFAFVLVRLSEQRSQRQKLLVRGRNGATEQQAFASAEQEAARVALAHRLVGPRVELLAAGRMEWAAATPDQRRKLCIRATRLYPPSATDTRLQSTAGASTVVAELARASFPAGDFDIEAADAPRSRPGSGGSSAPPASTRQQERAPALAIMPR